MTKEYNDSLIRSFVGFILKTLAIVLTVAGILLVSGIANIQFNNENHVKEVYVDGNLVSKDSWTELNNIVAGIDLNINVNKSSEVWSK